MSRITGKQILKLGIIIASLSSSHILAGELSAQDQKALKDTQQFLNNPAQRNKVINGSSAATQANQDAITAVGGNNLDQFYGVSSLALADIVKQANGDVTKMQAMLAEAAKNPEAFYKTLSPETQAAIRALEAKSGKPTH